MCRHAQVENPAHRLMTNVKIRHIINAGDYGKPKKKRSSKTKKQKTSYFYYYPAHCLIVRHTSTHYKSDNSEF